VFLLAKREGPQNSGQISPTSGRRGDYEISVGADVSTDARRRIRKRAYVIYPPNLFDIFIERHLSLRPVGEESPSSLHLCSATRAGPCLA
jgi:hypothetical protein